MRHQGECLHIPLSLFLHRRVYYESSGRTKSENNGRKRQNSVKYHTTQELHERREKHSNDAATMTKPVQLENSREKPT